MFLAADGAGRAGVRHRGRLNGVSFTTGDELVAIAVNEAAAGGACFNSARLAIPAVMLQADRHFELFA